MRSRLKGPPLVFVGGLSLVGWGISDETPLLWGTGLVVAALGLVLLARLSRRSR